MVKQIDFSDVEDIIGTCFSKKDLERETNKIKINIRRRMRNQGVLFKPPEFIFKKKETIPDPNTLTYDKLKEIVKQVGLDIPTHEFFRWKKPEIKWEPDPSPSQFRVRWNMGIQVRSNHVSLVGLADDDHLQYPLDNSKPKRKMKTPPKFHFVDEEFLEIRSHEKRVLKFYNGVV